MPLPFSNKPLNPAAAKPQAQGHMRTAARLGMIAVGALLVVAPSLWNSAQAQEAITVYTSRHYASDDVLFKKFSSQTGIAVNVVKSNDEPLLERLRSEGAASPADVLLLADASRLWKAEQDGFFQPSKSAILKKVIPASQQNNDLWYGLSSRARVIVVDPLRVRPEQVKTYADLAKPEFKGMVCARSSAHPYMLSLIGSQLESMGPAKAKAWAEGVVANLARAPKGGDTDQIKAIASGECAIALSNSYYYVRLMRSDKADEREAAAKTRLVWPNQDGAGAHMNVSGGGILKSAKNAANARRFLEFLASAEAQQEFATGNNEWPVVAGIALNNPELESLGKFKRDPMPVAKFASRQRDAAALADQVGWR